MKTLRVILISGLSGSGKTTAIKALEDTGFYCVDNLPILLFPKFLELCEQSEGKVPKVAVVEDIRSYTTGRLPSGGDETETGKDFAEDSRQILQALREEGFHIEILFLECSDPILVRRYSETRRQHPLAGGGSVWEGIRKERAWLQGIRDMANEVIDTSPLNVHQLKNRIQHYAQEGGGFRKMAITLLSFGYSFGVPYEIDLLMDVRFLPNPYFVEELKGLTGEDPQIRDYLLQWEETREFLNRFYEFIRFLIPLYEREGKTHLTIGIGCTGGRHRSVMVVSHLAEKLKQDRSGQEGRLSVHHRDAEKG